MLAEEVTIGIYPEGELNDVLIVPDGHEYHLFLTGTHSHQTILKKPLNLGSIVFVNNDWIYEGTGLAEKSQKEIADYIMSYPGDDEEHSALM